MSWLTDLVVDEVSLVDRPAHRRRFRIFKRLAAPAPFARWLGHRSDSVPNSPALPSAPGDPSHLCSTPEPLGDPSPWGESDLFEPCGESDAAPASNDPGGSPAYGDSESSDTPSPYDAPGIVEPRDLSGILEPVRQQLSAFEARLETLQKRLDQLAHPSPVRRSQDARDPSRRSLWKGLF